MQGIEAVHHCTFWGGGGASADMNELRLTAERHAMAAPNHRLMLRHPALLSEILFQGGQSNLGMQIRRSTTGAVQNTSAARSCSSSFPISNRARMHGLQYQLGFEC